MKYVIITILVVIAIPVAMSASTETLDVKLTKSFTVMVNK